MKTYQRGPFRAIKHQPKPEEFPKYWAYAVQARVYGTVKIGEPESGDWVTIESMDYAGNARLRVRNLHAACCIHADLAKPESSPILHDLHRVFAPRKPQRAAMNHTALYEDNNGGDIIEVIKQPDGQFRFQVGWQCVMFVQQTGTISELAEWFARMEEPLMRAGYSVRDKPPLDPTTTPRNVREVINEGMQVVDSREFSQAAFMKMASVIKALHSIFKPRKP